MDNIKTDDKNKMNADDKNSILTSTKKLLNIAKEDTSFDLDIILNINSVFMILHQMGVGPEECYHIDDANNTWDEFLVERKDLEAVKTYIALKIKPTFDPPQNSTLANAIAEQVKELEWRLNFRCDCEKDDISP